MSTDAPQAARPPLPAAVRLGWTLVRSTADFGWRLVQRQTPPALAAGPIGRAVVRSRTSAALRSGGVDLEPDPEHLAKAFPHATGRLLVLVPDSTEDETVWRAGEERYGGTYATRLARLADWTPVHLRAAAPTPEGHRAAELAALLQRLVDHWPEPVERVALVAHGDGGLALRAAAGLCSLAACPWTDRVTDVVLLGTPHLVVEAVSRSTGVGRQLDEELAGIVTSARVAADVEPIPGAAYTVVTRPARLRRSAPGALLGGLLWWRDRPWLRRRSARQLFPTATVVHVDEARAPLTNHPEVQRALLDWLA